MIIGIGVDLIKIQRIREAIDRSGNHFLEKLFTQAEIDLASKEGDRIAFFATRFAAKESILKAFRTGWVGVKGTDMEIDRGSLGEPIVKLSGNLTKIATRMGVNKVLLSISYDSEYAIAVSVLLGS